jgi:hypothetical protein
LTTIDLLDSVDVNPNGGAFEARFWGAKLPIAGTFAKSRSHPRGRPRAADISQVAKRSFVSSTRSGRFTHCQELTAFIARWQTQSE